MKQKKKKKKKLSNDQSRSLLNVAPGNFDPRPMLYRIGPQKSIVGQIPPVAEALSARKLAKFNANDTSSGPLMMRPYPRASGAYTRLPILRYTSPETKRSLCNRGVLNGCVYDRISSVIKKALQCVRVSKRGRATVVRVAQLESTPRRPYPGDKTFTILRATKVHRVPHPPSTSNPPFCSIYPRCLLK